MRFLKRFFSCVFVGFLLVSSCAREHRPTTLYINPPLQASVYKKTFHADTAFLPWERAEIDRAARRLNLQANGIVTVEIVYDLNWETGPVTDLDTFEHTSDQIVKIHSSTPLVKAMDSRIVKDTITVGYCKVNFDDPTVPTKVYLIHDRLNGNIYMHVALHEMLHALWMHHVPDEYAVMYWKTEGPAPAECMNTTDMKEFCRVFKCDPRSLNFCD